MYHPNYQSCLKAVIEQIDVKKQSFSNKELLAICREEAAADFLRGEANPHLAHELAETALNFLILKKYAKPILAAKNPAEILHDVFKPLVSRLPTQTWRSRKQNGWQQFSTPPAIAYLLVYLLNLQMGERVLEPSAGTGSLAVWSAGGGLETFVNEIDPRRRELLREVGFASTAFDAEFINDFLPPETQIDCVLMNPPFSSNNERTKNNSSKFGFRHVESALERLKKGGKFGIILGEAAGLDTKTGNDFWSKLTDRIEVKTIIKISGREYYKNGTSVDINLIVGEKLLETRKLNWHETISQIICVSAPTVEEAFEQARKLNLRLNH